MPTNETRREPPVLRHHPGTTLDHAIRWSWWGTAVSGAWSGFFFVLGSDPAFPSGSERAAAVTLAGLGGLWVLQAAAAAALGATALRLLIRITREEARRPAWTGILVAHQQPGRGA